MHFNTLQPDFGRPPRPLSIAEWDEADYRPIGSAGKQYTDWNQELYLRTRWEARGIEALANVRCDEAAGRFEESMEHYRNALKHGAGDPAAIRDRTEIRRELNGRLDRKLLTEYLSARRDYEFSHLKRSESRMKRLVNDTRAGILRAHAHYVLGAIQYDRGQFKEAAALFERTAALFPKSSRREAALIMVACSLLRTPEPKERFPSEWVDKPFPNSEAVTRARKALQILLRNYPRTRFRAAAAGWLARCDYVQGRRVEALESYLRQFGTLTPESGQLGAAFSICVVSRALTPAEAKQLRIDLIRDPDLLTPYLDFRLHHGRTRAKQFPQLADLATEAAKCHRLRLPARIAARLAEVQYLRGRYRDAVRWASHARSSLRGEGKDLALYVRGASRRKLGLLSAAEFDFRRLLRQYPDSYLCGSARENLALVCERRGRLDRALNEYFKLGYRKDIAYILDARMTTRQVNAHVRSHPHHRQRDLLIYTLGIRQLRDNDLSCAASTLSRLSDRTVREMMAEKREDYWWQSIHTVPRDPRKTCRDLAHLERAVLKARSAEARAVGLYEQASYIYKNRDLLFYNAALWHGNRSVSFGWHWDEHVATRRDNTAVREHHHVHECLCRARQICLEIARRYPKSPVAPKALYRAACATHCLADFNDWWRGEADRVGLWDQSVRLMKRVDEKYPNDPLAKSARKYARVFANGEAEAIRWGVIHVAKKPTSALSPR